MRCGSEECLPHDDSNINAPIFMTKSISKDKVAVLVTLNKGRGGQKIYINIQLILTEH